MWGDVRIFSLLGFSLLRGSGFRARGEPEHLALLGEPPGKGSVSRIAAGRASLLRQSLRTFPMPGGDWLRELLPGLLPDGVGAPAFRALCSRCAEA